MRDIPKIQLDLAKPESFGNVAEKLDPDARRVLATDLIDLIGVDETSMNPWLGKVKGYLDKLENERDARRTTDAEGTNEEAPPSTEMTLSAIIQFSARATAALLGEPDLARASEEGAGGEALARWVSSQIRTKDANWVLDMDPLVVHMSATGLAWRKRDFDDDDRVFHSHFLPCTDVKVNANITAIERAPRISHEFERYPYEIERSIQRKKWIDYEPRFDDNDPQAPKRFYETDLWLDLDHDGITEPWTVVINLDDMAEVVRMRPRWSAKTVSISKNALYFNPVRRFYPYRFLPNPDGGFFPMGFGALLDRTESSANTLLASIIETAKSEAANAGVFGGSAYSLPASIELKENQVTTLPTDGAPLNGRFQAFPVKQVSPGSVAALEKLMTLGDRLTGSLNLLENAPASMTATMAKGIIDTGQQIQSAVHRRLTESMTQEFRMFVQMASAYDMLPPEVSASDADGIAVTADPQLATEMQRSAMAGLYMEMIKSAGEGAPFDPQEIAIRFCKVLRLSNPEKLIRTPQPPQLDPKDKAKATIDFMKQKTEQMKALGGVAVDLTQSLLNMTQAAGGMQNNRLALLQMAQLENVVKTLIGGAQDVGSGLDNMAQQPGNASAAGLPPPQEGGANPDVSGGQPSGPGDAGPGSGVA